MDKLPLSINRCPIVDIIHHFASNILDNIKDLEPEFSKTVDENFWDLI